MDSHKKRKICIVTGSRAEYGLLYWLLKEIQKDPALKLQLVVTGMHLKKEFGLTYKVIEKDGFKIDAKIEILKFPDTEEGVTKSIGLGCQLFAEVFQKFKPDIVLILGDRFEMFAVATAAYVAQIPLAHIHGGETTEGVIDEGFRHSITKMSSIHFISTEDYLNRVVQMGESPERIFNVGAPGLDNLYRIKLLSKGELSKKLKFQLGSKVAIVTYHPITLEKVDHKKEIQILLNVIDEFDFQVIFTKANADPYGNLINSAIGKFCKKNPRKYRLFDSVGQLLYYSALRHCQLMIGNSSSGIIEAPSFHLPVVNIGDRQKNRVKGANVIDVRLSVREIKEGIFKALSHEFHSFMEGTKNPYDKYMDGKTSYRIKETLKKIKIGRNFVAKSFHDLNVSKRFSEIKKVLVIAPHPDDETLGCGGTLLKLKNQGCELYWLIMTNVVRSSNYSRQWINIRQQEIGKVSKLYEFNKIFKFNLQPAKLDQMPQDNLVSKISEIFFEVQPDTIFIPNRGDIHSDHRITFEATMSCTKSFRFPYVKRVLMYETISETEVSPSLVENSFIPNVFIDVTNHIDKKLKIMNTYASEVGAHPFPRSDKNILALATFRGASVNVSYAEAFMLLKEVI